MLRALMQMGAELLLSRVRLYRWHAWERTGKGVRACSRCGQKTGHGAVTLPLLPCDEEICRDVLDT